MTMWGYVLRGGGKRAAVGGRTEGKSARRTSLISHFIKPSDRCLRGGSPRHRKESKGTHTPPPPTLRYRRDTRQQVPSTRGASPAAISPLSRPRNYLILLNLFRLTTINLSVCVIAFYILHSGGRSRSTVRGREINTRQIRRVSPTLLIDPPRPLPLPLRGTMESVY